MNTLNTIDNNIDDIVFQKGMVITSNIILDGELLKKGSVIVSFDGGTNFEKYMVEVYDENNSYATDEIVYCDGFEYKSLISSNTSPCSNGDWQLIRVVEFNGILLDDLPCKNDVTYSSAEAAVLVMGSVSSSKVIGTSNYSETKKSLFRNKIVLV